MSTCKNCGEEIEKAVTAPYIWAHKGSQISLCETKALGRIIQFATPSGGDG